MTEKIVLGLVETIKINSNLNDKELEAKIDTGATKSSVDTKLAAELKLGPIVKTKFVKSASGSTMRPVIHVKFNIAGKQMEEEFTLADRKAMKYAVLIGQNVLKKGFIIDPSKGCIE